MTLRARHTVYLHLRTSAPIASVALAVAMVFFAGCGKNATLGLREYQAQTEQVRGLFAEGREVEALALAKDLLSRRPEGQQDSILSEALTLAALCEERLGKYDEALADFKRAMESAHLSLDQRLERQNKLFLSRYYFASADYALAGRLAQEAAAAARVFSDSGMMLEALTLSTAADARSGETARCLRTIDELERRSSAGLSPDLMSVRFLALLRAGRDGDIRSLFASWKSALRSAPDREAAMTAARCSGLYQETLGNADSALAFYSSALSSFEPRTDTLITTELFSSLGNVAYRLRHFADARRYYSDALERAEAAGNTFEGSLLRLAVAACDWKTAGRQGSSGPEDPALRIETVLKKCREERLLRGEALAEFLLGALAEGRGDAVAARASYGKALDAARSFPDDDISVAGRLMAVLLGSEQSSWHKAPVRLAAELNDAVSAFEGNEKESMEDIGNFLLGGPLQMPDEAARLAVEQLQWKRRTAARCEREIEAEHAGGRGVSQARRTALAEASRTLRAEADQAARDFAAAAPRLRWVLTERSVSVRAVQDTLPEQSALLEYIVAPKQLSILVLRKDTLLLRTVDVASGRLLSMIGEYNRLLGDAKLSADGTPAQSASAVRRMRDLASILSEFLVQPALSALRGSETIYVVSPREFGWLPFHTLRVSSGDGATAALMEHYAVKYLPSAAALFSVPVQDRPVRTVSGLGYQGNTGWDVEYELTDIRSFYDKAPMAFDTAATWARLQRLAGDAVHVAAEFVLVPSDPERSGMILADGVTPYGKTLSGFGALAAMPPCPTLIVSNISAAPGGLCRYAPAVLLATGQRTLIATMWRGDRKAKRYFGEIFYTNLSTGLPSGEAYRSAVLAMVKKGEFAAEQRWGLYFQFGR